MENDYFESSTISMILSWIFCVPILIGMLSLCIQWLYEKQEDALKLLHDLVIFMYYYF